MAFTATDPGGLNNSDVATYTVRPVNDAPRDRAGLYVFRFFDVMARDIDEFVALSGRAWTTFETAADQFTFNTAPYAATKSLALQKVSAEKVGVFPNPYYAFNAAETNRLVRFVTFNNLPPKVKVRIFNLAGQLVRVLDKDNTSQFLRWDLTNADNYPVASGMYLAYLELTMPDDGSVVTKVLKLAIIQEQEILNVY